MFAPIYVSEAPAVSRAVLQREAELLARDGQHHVGEAYFPNPADARIQRRWQAELEVQLDCRRSNSRGLAQSESARTIRLRMLQR